MAISCWEKPPCSTLESFSRDLAEALPVRSLSRLPKDLFARVLCEAAPSGDIVARLSLSYFEGCPGPHISRVRRLFQRHKKKEISFVPAVQSFLSGEMASVVVQRYSSSSSYSLRSFVSGKSSSSKERLITLYEKIRTLCLRMELSESIPRLLFTPSRCGLLLHIHAIWRIYGPQSGATLEEQSSRAKAWLQKAPFGDRELYLKGSLWTLPSEISYLTEIKRIFIQSPSLGVLPDQIGGLLELEEISFPYHDLTALAPSMKKLTRVWFLDLTGNKLSSLPEIEQWAQLRSLLVGYNAFCHLPSLKGFSCLQTLNVAGNPLVKLPELPEGLELLLLDRKQEGLFREQIEYLKQRCARLQVEAVALLPA